MARSKKMKPIEKEQFERMPVSEKLKQSENIGAEVQKLLNKAVIEANKLLNPLGYALNPIKAEFGELEQ